MKKQNPAQWTSRNLSNNVYNALDKRRGDEYFWERSEQGLHYKSRCQHNGGCGNAGMNRWDEVVYTIGEAAANTSKARKGQHDQARYTQKYLHIEANVLCSAFGIDGTWRDRLESLQKTPEKIWLYNMRQWRKCKISQGMHKCTEESVQLRSYAKAIDRVWSHQEIYVIYNESVSFAYCEDFLAKCKQLADNVRIRKGKNYRTEAL